MELEKTEHQFKVFKMSRKCIRAEATRLFYCFEATIDTYTLQNTLDKIKMLNDVHSRSSKINAEIIAGILKFATDVQSEEEFRLCEEYETKIFHLI